MATGSSAPPNTWDGSSVDPVDNITGLPVSTGRGAASYLQTNVVMQQPHGNIQHGNTNPTTSKQRPRLRECWNDQYYLWDILLTEPNSNCFVLEQRTREWRDMLLEEDVSRLTGYIHRFIKENLEQIHQISLLCNKPEIQALVQTLNIPEENVLKISWGDWIKASRNDSIHAKRLLEIFMGMQLQLQAAKNDLEQVLKFAEPETDEHMDTSIYSTESPSVYTENSHLQQITLLQQQNDALRDQNTTLTRTKLEIEMKMKELFDTRENLTLDRDVVKENQKLRKQLVETQGSSAHLSTLYQKLEREFAEIKGDNKKLQKELKSLQVEKDSWESNSRHLSEQISNIDKEKGTLESENTQLKVKIKKLEGIYEGRIKDESLQTDVWKQRYLQKKKEVEDIQTRYTTLHSLATSKMNELERKKIETDELQKAYNGLKKTKEDLLTRLSKLAGAKLTHGNADITDLSDENRPTKLAEKFMELYDNEWTDALEELIMVVPAEEKAIEINLNIVSSAYEFCSTASKAHADDLMHTLAYLPRVGDDPDINEGIRDEKGATISPENEKDIEDIRRSLAPQLIAVAEQRFCLIAAKIIKNHLHKTTVQEPMSALKQPREAWADTADSHRSEEYVRNETGEVENAAYSVHQRFPSSRQIVQELMAFIDTYPSTKAFAKKCAKLCWLMRIPEPHVHMIYDIRNGKGKPFNTEWFRHYTRTGKLLNFVVWPVLFLHENGPILAKGVAQPVL